MKLVWTWNALVNQPWGGEAARGMAGLLFFPRALVDLSGSWWMSSILWAGLAVAWMTRHRPGVPFLALLTLTMFIIGEFHHTKLDRHILPMFPPMFVLAGVAAARVWEWLRARGAGGAAVAVSALTLISLFHATALVRRDWMPNDLNEDDVVDYVIAQVREEDSALVLATKGSNPGPPVMDWHLVSQDLLPVTAAGTVMNPPLERWLRSQIRGAPIPERARLSLWRLLNRYDARSNTRSFAVGDRGPVTRARFETLLTTTLRRYPPRTIVAMIGTADTARYSESFVSPIPTGVGFRQVSVREFPHAKPRVYVYRRP
jgi:4-amino-4-deoxy-L-arabinose transferase-like glycosyltransferase